VSRSPLWRTVANPRLPENEISTSIFMKDLHWIPRSEPRGGKRRFAAGDSVFLGGWAPSGMKPAATNDSVPTDVASHPVCDETDRRAQVPPLRKIAAFVPSQLVCGGVFRYPCDGEAIHQAST
jgi:hypothetical protein